MAYHYVTLTIIHSPRFCKCFLLKLCIQKSQPGMPQVIDGITSACTKQTMTSLGFRVWRPCHAGNNAPKIELQFEAADEKSFACLLVWVCIMKSLTHKRRYRVQQAVQYRTYPSGSTCTMNLFATTALLSELHPGVYLTKSITVLVKLNTFELACKIDRYR